MKRCILCLLAVILCIVTVGCNGPGGENGTVAVRLSEPYSMTADVTSGDLTAAAEITRNGPRNWTASFTAPEALAGVVLSFVDNAVTASYKGLSFSVPQSALPVRSGLGMLFGVLDELADKNQLDCVKEDGTCRIEGSIEEGNYILTLDVAGVPTAFSIPGQGVEMRFSNFVAGSGNGTVTGSGTVTGTTPAVTTGTAAGTTAPAATTVTTTS